MASNLIIHERIRTTYGKAKSLAYLMNNLFKCIAPMDNNSLIKARKVVRLPLAYKKLMNGFLDKYRYSPIFKKLILFKDIKIESFKMKSLFIKF